MSYVIPKSFILVPRYEYLKFIVTLVGLYKYSDESFRAILLMLFHNQNYRIAGSPRHRIRFEYRVVL